MMRRYIKEMGILVKIKKKELKVSLKLVLLLLEE